MVFFTCNHCGESLKKPAVEKHYQFKSCRGAVPFLTCVDCLKDFRDNEFKEHTKCISEEEKYSAKGFVAKPNKNKGAQKQEAWTETLQNLINKPGMDYQTKNIIERIAAQTNVPRKKPKFINFVKNSLKISVDNATKVWNILEEALEEFKQMNDEKNKQKKELENKAKESSKNVDEEASTGDGKKKKKKKNKTNGDSNEKMAIDDDEENGTDEPTTKKKKKKNRKIQNNIADGANGDINENTKIRKLYLILMIIYGW